MCVCVREKKKKKKKGGGGGGSSNSAQATGQSVADSTPTIAQPWGTQIAVGLLFTVCGAARCGLRGASVLHPLEPNLHFRSDLYNAITKLGRGGGGGEKTTELGGGGGGGNHLRTTIH